VIVRIAIWSLFDSKTTIDELREFLPHLDEPSIWIWSDAREHFGLVAFGEDVPVGFERARELIGRDPEVYEEFDVL
jgi:hypothetical protein